MGLAADFGSGVALSAERPVWFPWWSTPCPQDLPGDTVATFEPVARVAAFGLPPDELQLHALARMIQRAHPEVRPATGAEGHEGWMTKPLRARV